MPLYHSPPNGGGNLGGGSVPRCTEAPKSVPGAARAQIGRPVLSSVGVAWGVTHHKGGGGGGYGGEWGAGGSVPRSIEAKKFSKRRWRPKPSLVIVHCQYGLGGLSGEGGGGSPTPPPPVSHAVGLLLLYGALDGHPFFAPRAASGRCFLSAAAAGAPAGVISAFAEPSRQCTGAVLDVAGCAVCVSTAPSNWPPDPATQCHQL